MVKVESTINNENVQQELKYFGFYKPQGLYNNEPEYNVEKVKILIDTDKLAPFYEGISDYVDNPYPEEKKNNNEKENIVENSNKNNENNNTIKNKNSVEINIAEEKKFKKTNSIIKIDIPKIKFNKNKKEKEIEKEIYPSSVVIDIDLLNKVDNHLNQNENEIQNGIIKSNNKNIPIEMTLTKETIFKYPILCPICFLYYPRNINYTKCCDQPICTECFTQIKRIILKNKPENSKSANCPYCSTENLGIYYLSPDSDDYKDQYETFVKAKELKEEEYQNLFKDESFQGKKKKDLKSLTEDEIVTSEYIYEEWFNEQVEHVEELRTQRELNDREEARRLRKRQYIAFIINLICFLIIIFT